MLLIFPFAALGIASLVIAIMTAVDASKYPEWAFQQSGTTKFVWQVIPLVLLFLCGIAGGIMGLVWYSSKRDEVARVAAAGPPQYGYGTPGYGPPPQGPPSGYGPPPQYPPPPVPPAPPEQ